MEAYTIEHLTFTYPGKREPVLKDICLDIWQGQFVTICGKSGCGKTTLLRLLKSVLSPHGIRDGKILFEGSPLESFDQRTQSERIGFVLQSPDNQIVTDKVWHELAFGLESLGCSTPEIRTRVAEMASFFGIQTWFHKSVTELSGGQKQLLNLAAVMVMQPSILILDEPTSQLDPIAASEFLKAIEKINRELGTTVILTEHRLEDAFPMSDRVIVIDKGQIIADGNPREVCTRLGKLQHEMFIAMPTPMRVYSAVKNELECPITVREGRTWLQQMARDHSLDETAIPVDATATHKGEPAIELSEVWFRYDRDLPDVVKGMSAKIYQSELFAIVGGNGTGKTTSLSIMTGILKPYRGEVKVYGRKLSEITDSERYDGLMGVLPQNPQALFVKKTVELDLFEMFSGRKIPNNQQKVRVSAVSAICELDALLSMHPYDLSGGEQQRAALAKVLLLTPRILLLDEPTKGLDGHFKEKLAGILRSLKASGVTVVMVSHDIEFCARHADRCAMFFDGSIVSTDKPRCFFAGKNFYTTAANRMARKLLPNAVLTEDIILACGSEAYEISTTLSADCEGMYVPKQHDSKPKILKEKVKLTPKRIAISLASLILFILTAVFFSDRWKDWRNYLVQVTLILEMAIGFTALLSEKTPDTVYSSPGEKRKLSKRTLAAMAMVLVAIPLTIYVGIFFLGDRKYYFISLVIILETMLPFALVFESRKPQARELAVISVLCAIGVSGRTAFFMLPQFKPVVAIIIITGVCFGGEAGFLVGAVTGFVSNMFFGQGPWTPWQMFAFGIIGFLAGILFRKGLLRKVRSSLCIFGGFATFFIYGGIMNPASVLMWQAKPNREMFISAYLMGIPFDLIHAVATVFFLWFISGPMIEKLDRIKVKYGLIE
ncbi:MAG TPA: energy-coupling factor transporter ATPase [Negativicutes bacterium]|nr:energy-coupling factor transporter ATPase [Negativicutes bacterium]